MLKENIAKNIYEKGEGIKGKIPKIFNFKNPCLDPPPQRAREQTGGTTKI